MSINYPRRYYHGKNQMYISYRCGVCGRSTWATRSVPQCGVCSTTLCKTCNRFGFCVKHFSVLTLEDQRWARATALKKVLVKVLLAGIGIIVIGLGIAWRSDLLPFYDKNIPSILISNLGTLGVLFGCVIGAGFYLQAITRRAEDVVQGIGHEYLSGNYNSEQPEKELKVLPDQSITRHCPKCGSSMLPGAEFCSNCGSGPKQVKETK